MKAFANITLRELSDARYEMRQAMKGVPADLVDDMVCWDAVGEYLHENFGQHWYDDEDRYLIYDELCMSHDSKYLYVLEVQEDEHGNEYLYIETIMNGK